MADLTVPIRSKDIKQRLTVRVKIARSIGVRFWLLPKLLRFAAWVGGVGIEIETTAGEADENRSDS